MIMPHWVSFLTIPAVLVVAGLLTFRMTDFVRAYALRHSILDVPTERSSHKTPTARGGGLAIAVVLFTAILGVAIAGWMPTDIAVALVGGGVIVAGVGWVDDRRGVQPLLRVVAHGSAALWAIYWLHGFPTLQAGIHVLRLGAWGSALAFVGIIWAINLYNFMDGIDGLAATEGLTAGLTAGALLLWQAQLGLGLIALIVAAASAGFLRRNWPPASIFMGDVGSGLLGYVFSVLAIASERSSALPLLVWVMILGIFVVDATLTVIRRLAKGERFYLAHRSHAYQRLAQIGWTHQRVVCSIAVTNMVLACLAVVGVVRPDVLLWMVLIAAGLIVAAYIVIERIGSSVQQNLPGRALSRSNR
jgi:Fuc2NAc and GlcNAc transferase